VPVRVPDAVQRARVNALIARPALRPRHKVRIASDPAIRPKFRQVKKIHYEEI